MMLNDAALAITCAPVEQDADNELKLRLLPIARRVEELYNEFLDQYEGQIHSTSKINVSIGELLQRTGEDQILKWNPDAALSPKNAFITLADAIARQAAPHLGLTAGKSTFRYLDLIDWIDPPYTAAMSAKEIQLTRIDYSRTRSLVGFLDDLLVRYRPDTVPEHAMSRATYEFCKTFAVPTPLGTVIPIKPGQRTFTNSYRFLRQGDEMLWYFIPRHHSAITRASNAIATIAILSGRPEISFGLGDMLNAMEHHLSKTMMRFEEGDYFQAGAFMRLVLHRDTAAFHFGETTFKLIRSNVEKYITDIRFIEY